VENIPQGCDPAGDRGRESPENSPILDRNHLARDLHNCNATSLGTEAGQGAVTMKSILTALILAGFTFAATPSTLARSSESAKTETKQAAPKVFSSPQKEGTKASCPVTGEEFTIAKDTVHAEYQGKHVYFCCGGCKKAFDKDPAKYTK
jgi:YHS domain-containing protein